MRSGEVFSRKGELTMSSTNSSTPGADPAKQPWEPMKLTCVGNIREVVQMGGGKSPTVGGDSGEPYRKPDGLG
jgi:hypothetical protein